MKKALLSFGDLSIAAYRVLAGAIALWLFWFIRNAKWPFTRQDFWPMLGIAIMGYALPFWIQPFVIGVTSSSFVGMQVSLVPLLTIVVSMPLLGIYPTKRELLGVLGGLSCMALIFRSELHHAGPLGPMLLGLITPLGYALTNTFIKRRFAKLGPLVLTASAMSLAALILLPLSLSFEKIAFNEHFQFALICVLTLGILATGIATVLFYSVLRDHGPLYASMVTYVIPCISLIVGWLDHERFDVIQLGALFGIFLGLILVQHKPKKKSTPKPLSS